MKVWKISKRYITLKSKGRWMKKYIIISLLLCGLLHAEELSTACYRDNDKNVVICSEKKLGRLMWQDEKQSFQGTWEQAQEYCKIVKPSRIQRLEAADRDRAAKYNGKIQPHSKYHF